MAVILVVDDDEGIRGFVSMLLKSAGHEIVTAANGAEAVAVYRSFARQIDLVIMDINMPVMDGVQAILRIRMTRPDAKFICMTGNPEAADRLEGVIVLDKPFSKEKLIFSVDELLRSSMSTP
jgi:CheY-like chemotaxis protein